MKKYALRHNVIEKLERKIKIYFMVPRAGLEPARAFGPRDFKSLASTYSATPAYTKLEAAPRIELGIAVLQTTALPLGYAANFFLLT
jgi:hypothetical protein